MVGWGNSHEVSILIIGGIGLARFLGAQPGSKISMTIIRPPQQGQGRGSTRGSSGAAALGQVWQATCGRGQCWRRVGRWRAGRSDGCGGSFRRNKIGCAP
jgi:hypothetical protein